MKRISLSQISAVNKKINSSMELPELLTGILDLAKGLVKSESSSILLHEADTGDLIFDVVLCEKGYSLKGEKVPVGKGIAGYAAKTGKSLIVNDVQNDPRFFRGIDNKSSFTTQHILCVPMKVRGKLIGVLEVVNAINNHGFDTQDLKLLTYLAEQAAISISNRMLYNDLRSRINELTALYEISQSISFADPEEDIFDKVIQSVAHSLDAEKASIIFHNKLNDKFFIIASRGLPSTIKSNSEIHVGENITGFVFKKGHPLIVSDIEKEISFPLENRERRYNTRSFISVPIRSQKQIIGVMSIADKKDQRDFDSNDLRTLQTIGSQIAEIYKNSIYQKEIKKQKTLSKEIDIASKIQKQILPKIPEKHRNHRIAAFHKPAKEVGGDFYDFFKFDENKYAALVADVSGKGIPAALFMTAALNIMRAETRLNNQPSSLLSSSNLYINHESEHGMFVSLFYMLVDSHNNIFTYGNAGHNDQLFIKNRTSEILKLNAKGKALGLDSNSVYEEKVMLYDTGDLIVLFTDGVLERLGDGDINKGEETLAKISLNSLNTSPLNIIQSCKDYLDNNYIEDKLMDDFTILAIQF
ncbi:MAG: SpoIIE family protein phosphatase [Spirochaetota bacterium]|nr:SpoIIE family protein phosphatase [Spirochaetota bacterium]